MEQNITEQVVYTMLRTIITDDEQAASLVPKVCDRIYQNTESMENTEVFCQWAAKYANEEAMQYLANSDIADKGQNDYINVNTDIDINTDINTDINKDINIDSADETTEQFYDYAVWDEEFTISDEEFQDAELITKLQLIFYELAPMEKLVFQDYYYFGAGVPEIAAKTGWTNNAVRQTLGKTRTAMISAITETEQKNVDEKQYATQIKHKLKDTPWLWLIFRNYISESTGFEQMLGQAIVDNVAVGQAIGDNVAAGQAIGDNVAAGQAIGNNMAAGILKTAGGKIAAGIVGAAVIVAIGVGIHNAASDSGSVFDDTLPGNQIVPSEEFEPVIPDATTEIEETEETEEETEQYEFEEQTQLEVMIEQARKGMDEYEADGTSEFLGYYSIITYERKNSFYVIEDIDGDGDDELLFGCWNPEKGIVEVRDICEALYHPEARYGEVYYSEGNVMTIRDADGDNYDLEIYDPTPEDDYSKVFLLKLLCRDGVTRYYELGGGVWPNYYDEPLNVNYETFLGQLDDESASGYYMEISEAEWTANKEAHPYKKLEWKPLFEDDTILNEDSSIPDADGRF